MQLFQLRSHQVIYEPQIMELRAFAAIRDKNKEKDWLTVKELSYIWFFADVRSFYQSVLDEEDRMFKIIDEIAMPDDWRPSIEVKAGIAFYEKYSRTASSGLYSACLVAAQFIEEQLKNPETLLSTKDGRGNPIYKLDTLLKIMKDVPGVMKNLHEAREQVIKEIEEKAEARGNKTKAVFEDGI